MLLSCTNIKSKKPLLNKYGNFENLMFNDKLLSRNICHDHDKARQTVSLTSHATIVAS